MAESGSTNTKKKIIPVQSDSSESGPSSPTESPQPPSLSLSARFRMSQGQDDQSLQPHQPLGQKLKNSFSFRDRKEPQNLSNRSDRSANQGRKHSVESQSSFRSTSSSSQGSQGPPHGTRVVLGRETSPVQTVEDRNTGRLPGEVTSKFSGQSREDLIEMLVRLQGTVETQGKKVADLEDYIDGLLIRVMETNPVLLEKNIIFTKNPKKVADLE